MTPGADGTVGFELMGGGAHGDGSGSVMNIWKPPSICIFQVPEH